MRSESIFKYLLQYQNENFKISTTKKTNNPAMYHSGRKHKDILSIHMNIQRSLYFHTEGILVQGSYNMQRKRDLERISFFLKNGTKTLIVYQSACTGVYGTPTLAATASIWPEHRHACDAGECDVLSIWHTPSSFTASSATRVSSRLSQASSLRFRSATI